MPDNSRDCTDPSVHHGQSVGQGFEQPVGCAFEIRGEDANRRLVVNRTHVRDTPAKLNGVWKQPETSGLIFQCRSQVLVLASRPDNLPSGTTPYPRRLAGNRTAPRGHLVRLRIGWPSANSPQWSRASAGSASRQK